ncbi:diacylglycerol O-acyltransferase 1 [Terramyces sp. JEL0728]|nr:diacylglycerol O-acyltransferase 1 [Terramyces sp. JEL0728]
MQLTQTHDLDPDKSYMFCYSNGSLGLGGFVNFCTTATEFNKILNTNTNLLIPSINFYVPFARDFLLAMGCVALNRTTCENVVAKGKGESLVMSVDLPSFELGKANYKQLGFIKFALQHGVSLVPVISLGEDDIWYKFTIRKGTILFEYLDSLLELISLRLGRDRTVSFLGPLPRQIPIKTIIGKPLNIPVIRKPNLKEILHYYELYKTSLYELINENNRIN